MKSPPPKTLQAAASSPQEQQCFGDSPSLVPVFALLSTLSCLLLYRAAARFCSVLAFSQNWGIWIRTRTSRTKICCATVTPSPKRALTTTIYERQSAPAIDRDKSISLSDRPAWGQTANSAARSGAWEYVRATSSVMYRGREDRFYCGLPSLRTGRADLPHPALRLMYLLQGLTCELMGHG